MPESKPRQEAGAKKHQPRNAGDKAKRVEKRRRATLLDNRGWVAPTFITVGLLGVLWLIVYYLAGYMIPFMATLGAWNLVVGMGLMAASFAIATLWK